MGPVGAALLYQTGYDCQGSRKCCMTKVGYDCTAPKEVSTTANQNQPQNSPAYNYTIGHEVNKPGKCPAESTIAGKALFCRSDKDCDGLEKCCVTKVGKECAKAVEKRMLPLAHQIHSCSPSISAAQDAKPNTCPPYPMGSVGAALFCQSGYDCQGSQKCCMTKVGYDCTASMEERTTAYQQQPQKSPSYNYTIVQEVNKPGNCPAEPTIAGKALFCRSDKDCDGSEKCCVTKVGKECVKPVQKRMFPLTHQIHS
ncbi:WAP-type 'four-disulfide core [Trichuris suis]|nr:WAP-type 'four-disulfide core [Trichuris suis]